jgi:hypothetical protein
MAETDADGAMALDIVGAVGAAGGVWICWEHSDMIEAEGLRFGGAGRRICGGHPTEHWRMTDAR